MIYALQSTGNTYIVQNMDRVDVSSFEMRIMVQVFKYQ
jgi:hypothetical protein